MVKLMVGRDVSKFYVRKPHSLGEERLRVKKLVTPTWPSHELSFSVRAGEIVGIAGLVGAGRTELLQTLFGIDRIVSGSIMINGKTVAIATPADAIDAGIALVPENRKQHGLVLGMSVRQNISLAGLWKNRWIGGWRNSAQEQADSEAMTKEMRIRTPSDRQAVQFLSGGNQQKVVIGIWLAMQPQLLLLDEPTRGIDVGAKEEIYRLMESLAAQGLGILFVSSEMEEIIGMSDRTLVMHEGRITGEIDRDNLSEVAIMQLATGNLPNNPSETT
jgi:ribose transport system ATP-binding protein